MTAARPPAGRISLALTLHNHQPVGNFGWVIAETFERAYLPIVEALERHPRIRVGLHYTGPLLEWIAAERPRFLARVRRLVDDGRVEVLGGGLYEPVLAALPERDRVGQLEAMANTVETTFGSRPTGAWLAERVWEPDLPTSLAAAGYRWTILDDSHFRAAAIAEDAIWGPYTTEDQGRMVTVFGTEQGLRYLIPFQGVDDVIEHLREHATPAGDRLGTMGDDGEKFGAWPTTWQHCWGERRWVDRFFDALEANADWLTTVTPSGWLASNPPIGRVYIPTGSYAEMGEWALPTAESSAFGAALHHAVETGAPEARWLRGAFWRNFQVKYREINDLHKQMLRASRKVAAMPEGASREAALDHLYRGQSNDCYWHGLFGGVYIAHMRAATFDHLIAAEALADEALGGSDAAELSDTDMDGRDEVLLSNAGEVVVVDLDEGAGIGSWDVRAARHALTAVLRRRPEAYHDKLRLADAPASGAASAKDGVSSIHEIVRVKEPGLSALLAYDGYERRSGLVRFLAPDSSAATWASGGGPDLGDFVDGPFGVERLEPGAVAVARNGVVMRGNGGPAPVRVTKVVEIGGDRLAPTLRLRLSIENRSGEAMEARVGLEWGLTMLGGGGNPSAWLEVAGNRDRHDGAGTASAVDGYAQGNDYIGIAVDTAVSPPADAWWAPIETISNSEDGFERTYQGCSMLVSWPVTIGAGETWTASVDHAVRVSPTVTGGT
jgi:alpha-amylase